MIEIFYIHYKDEVYNDNRRLIANIPIIPFEEFKNRVEIDPEFRKKYIYLFHPSYIKDDRTFFEMIDFLGGWPHNAKSVVLRHQDNRACYFSKLEDIRDGWNTSIVTVDDYYWWKLSDKKKEEYRKEIRRNIGQSLL